MWCCEVCGNEYSFDEFVGTDEKCEECGLTLREVDKNVEEEEF